MEVVYERCSDSMSTRRPWSPACAASTWRGNSQEIRTFGTMTCDLLALVRLAGRSGVHPGGMESTGVYWKPVFNILEALRTSCWSTPSTSSRCPGRKTDVKDAAWIAQLLQHGLLRAASCRPRRSASCGN